MTELGLCHVGKEGASVEGPKEEMKGLPGRLCRSAGAGSLARIVKIGPRQEISK